MISLKDFVYQCFRSYDADGMATREDAQERAEGYIKELVLDMQKAQALKAATYEDEVERTIYENGCWDSRNEMLRFLRGQTK
jgi:hypothetical protein